MNSTDTNSMEFHDYPKKPQIEYKDTSNTYHYTILSEGHYPPSSILAKTQRKKNNCYRIPDNYKVEVSWAKKNKTRNLSNKSSQ